MLILPANLAFYLVLSIIPIIVLIGFITSILGLSLDNMINFTKENFPSAIHDLLLPFMQGKGIDFNVGFFTILAFITASNGPNSIIVTSNILFNIKQNSFLKRIIKAFILTVLLVTLFIFILIVLAFGNHIFSFLLNLKTFKNVSFIFYYIFIFIKWPIAFFIIFLNIKILYTIAPDKKIPSKYMTRGALITSLSWLLVTAIYSFYVSHFANYDLFYGSLSNIIILMMWLYILSYILVLGIVINSKNYDAKLEKLNNQNLD
jgi:membrane protein